MLRLLRQKVMGITTARQPFAKRANFVPVKREKGVGDKKRYIDLAFWRDGHIVQVAYVPSMNAIVFVDVEREVSDLEYKMAIQDSIQAEARVNKALAKGKKPDNADIEAMGKVYEAIDPETMGLYTKVLFDLPPSGKVADMAGLSEFKDDNKEEHKLSFGPIDGSLVVIKVTKILKDHEDKFGKHNAGHISASVSVVLIDETLSLDEEFEEEVEAAEVAKVEVISSRRVHKAS